MRNVRLRRARQAGLLLRPITPIHLGLPQDAPRAVRWVCGVIRLGKVAVLLINVYLYVEGGLSPENLAILGQIEQYGMELAMPIILGGDCNLEEDDIQRAGILQHFDSVAVRTNQLPTTTLRDGRSIDHVYMFRAGCTLLYKTSVCSPSAGDHTTG